MKVKYTGTSDFQEFSSADFKRAEIEAKKTSFPRGVEVEVPDEVGQALISDEGLFGGHSFEQVEEEEAAKGEKSEDSANDSSGKKSRARG